MVWLFWLVIAATVGFNVLFVPILPQWWATAIFAVIIVGIILIWRVMAWRPTNRRRDATLVSVFMLASISLGMTGSAHVHAPLLLIGVANVALVLGMRWALVTVVVVVVGMTGTMLTVGVAPIEATVQALAVALLTGFVLAMASAIIDARAAREKAQDLLLQVRELTLAEERARMAREMHDSLGQQLTVVKLNLENAERFRRSDPERGWREVGKAKSLTAEVLQDTRQWVRALRPLPQGAPVDSRALDDLAQSFAAAGLDVRFRVNGAEARFGPQIQRVLYRAMQEGLTNAVRHSGASVIHAVLAVADDRVELQISDDGKGGEVREGFGLSSLRERAESLGGSLRIDGADGFSLRVELPLAGAQVHEVVG